MPTTQALTSSETNNATAGKPVLLGHNQLADAPANGSVYWSIDGGITDAGAVQDLAAVAVDRRGDPLTRSSNISGPSTYTLAFALPVHSYVADMAAIVGTNLQALAASLSDSIVVDLDTADDSAFLTGLTQVASWTVSSSGPNRLGALFGSAYVGQRWWRLTFDRLSASAWPTSGGSIPQIGEVMVGKRRQIPFNPSRPFDYDALEVDEEVNTMPGGVIVSVRNSTGRGRWTPRFKLRSDQWGQSAKAVLQAWFDDSEYGRTSVWMPRATEPNRVHLVKPAGMFTAPEVNLNLSEISMDLAEQPPFYRPEIVSVGV